MRKIVNLILLLISLIAFYIITVVGLKIDNWKIGSYDNADGINSILINLSYSFIAGGIFYLFVTYLPYIYRKSKVNLPIKNRITSIARLTQSILVSFEPHNPNLTIEQVERIDLERITKNDLINLLRESYLFAPSNLSRQVVENSHTTHYFIINGLRREILEDIKELYEFMEFLSEEQIILLQKIKNAGFINTIKATNDDAFNRTMHRSTQAKNMLAEDFANLFEDVKKLYKTI